MIKAQAILWTAPKQVEVRTVELAEPGPGEVLIENACSLVSPGTEHTWLSSDDSHGVLGTTFPFIPGYSAAGRIAGLGPEVKGWSVGDAVVAGPVRGCHASHLVAPVATLFRVPAALSLRKAVFFNLGMTAVHTIRLSEVRLGDSLVIVGQGPIGAFATQVAKVQGACPIVALEIDEQRRNASRQLGATHVLDPTRSDEFEKVLSELGGGASASIDLSASSTGVNTAIHATAACGIVVLSSGTHEISINYGEMFVKGLVLKNAFVGARPEESRRDAENFLRLSAKGRITVPELDHEFFKPRSAVEVYDRILASDRSLIAPVFDWNESL